MSGHHIIPITWYWILMVLRVLCLLKCQFLRFLGLITDCDCRGLDPVAQEAATNFMILGPLQKREFISGINPFWKRFRSQ